MVTDEVVAAFTNDFFDLFEAAFTNVLQTEAAQLNDQHITKCNQALQKNRTTITVEWETFEATINTNNAKRSLPSVINHLSQATTVSALH